MMHKPIFIKDLCLSLPDRNGFEHFSCEILFGSRIAIIGRNGSGKSTLLKILQSDMGMACGEVQLPDDLIIGYVEQTIEDYHGLSGGQRLNKQLTKALAQDPNLLLLDEPTNHLDLKNRKSLMRRLDRYYGTLIVVSHDPELLRHCVDTLWHIHDHKIHVFSGSYDDYIREMRSQCQSVEQAFSRLKREKKEGHAQLMKEQKRAAKSKAKGQKSIDQRKWPTVVSKAKALRAQQTSGKKKSDLNRKKQTLASQLEALWIPKVIVPKFSLTFDSISNKTLISIQEASIGYNEDNLFLKNIHLSLLAKERIAIVGHNASGKTTLLKAIIGDSTVVTKGKLDRLKPEHIGYLDQHYANLDPLKTVYESLASVKETWSQTQIRRHLQDFLFIKNEIVNRLVKQLSGGEKARLSLSLIAAVTPRLLVLDEITNNLDLETKDHVIQVLKDYPGSMIIVSHEEDFLKQIGIDQLYTIKDGTLILESSEWV